MWWESARGIPTGQQLLGGLPGNANELFLMKLSLFYERDGRKTGN
jgi:hypothetical protein